MGNKMKGPYKTMCVKGKDDDDDGPNNDLRDTSEVRSTNKKSIKYIGSSISENIEFANKIGNNEDPNSTYDNSSQILDLQQYDTRYWDRQFDLWQKGKGPKPGMHPDPSCLWNTD